MAENLKERNLSPKDRILVCIDVDAIFWKPLVDLLMPDYDWDVYRKQGLLPVARGKVPREGLLKALQEAYFINLESITNAELLKEDNNDNYVVLSFANVGISAFNI